MLRSTRNAHILPPSVTHPRSFDKGYKKKSRPLLSFKKVLTVLLVLPTAIIILKHENYHFDEPVVAKTYEGNFENTAVIGTVPGLRIGKPAVTPVPPESVNLYHINPGLSPSILAIEHAFNTHFHDWKKSQTDEDAFIIWAHMYHDKTRVSKPWQRTNHFPGDTTFRKDRLPGELLRYNKRTGKDLPFLPESYRLDNEYEQNKFLERLRDREGMDMPWVLKHTRMHGGKGITMLGPRSDNLRELKQRLEGMDDTLEPYLVERYVCNELTYDGRKFDLRIYMLVASLDPLVVFYHDGFLRLAPGVHDETKFNSTSAHLTNQSRNKEAVSKGLALSQYFTQWEEALREHVVSNPSLKHITDPLGHIRSQMKGILAIVIEATRDSAFGLEGVVPENLFALLGADFIVDKDLNVWFIEANKNVGLVLGGAIDDIMLLRTLSIEEEIFEKQFKGEGIFPLRNLKGFELIYTDEEVYRHDFSARGESRCS